PRPRRIERGEDGAVLEMAQSGQQCGNLGCAEDSRQCEGAPGIRDILQHRWAPKRHPIEEAQRTDGLHHGGPGHLFVLDEKELIGADLLWAQMLRGGLKMLSEIGDTAEIRANSMVRVVTELEIVTHPWAWCGHAA